MTRADRSISLDLLRAIAIFLVLGRHSEPVPEFYPEFFRAFMRHWQIGGWVGVDLFFVLSGFLVSGLLFRELQGHGEIRVGRFLLRRGLKIYPAFFVFILVTVLVRLATGKEVPARQLLAEVLFVQNYFEGMWGYTWTLAVEEHFYLLLPPVLILLVGRRANAVVTRVFVLFAVVAVLCWFFRSRIDPGVPFHYQSHLAPTHLRMDSLLAGVVLSAFYHFRREAFVGFVGRYRWALLAVGVAAFVPAFLFVIEQTRWIYVSGVALFYFGGSCVLMGALGREPASVPFRVLAFVGAHSYSIYLWHGASIWARLGVTRLMGGTLDWWSDFLIYISFSLVVGIGMSKLVEWPVLRLRDRWFPSRARAPVTPAVL